MTTGQRLALEQIHEIELFSDENFELVSSSIREEEGSSLILRVSIYTEHVPRAQGGLPLRGREQFIIQIPAAFPFKVPKVFTPHSRFADWPHVQWKCSLCLYLSTDTEWNPSDGMFGFVDRLWLWIKKGALNELDPEPPRVCRRLQNLRTWSHEQKNKVFPRDSRTCCTNGV